MVRRLVENWVYGGFLAGVLLLLLTPVIARSWSPALVATYLCLPVYMIHQYEEHDNDRFRLAVNKMIGHGKEVLSPWAVFLINVPGVWGVMWLSILLAVTVNLGYGLIGFYLMLVNAVVHIAQGLRLREYNAGLGTAIGLFVPLGMYGLIAIQRSGAGTPAMQLTGLMTAIAIHAAIVIHVRLRLAAYSVRRA